MNPRSIAALIAVNAALLAALAVSLFSPEPAQAQFAEGRQYVMLAGESSIRNGQSVVYIIDMQSSAMVALLFSSANSEFRIVGARRVGDDLQTDPTVGR